ncbi:MULTISPECIES: hypothetical protein [Halomonadaceae]|uniref:hypothetical protein n=1 Tax=Halomonadaceae TaxID=28256 RepID=UPI001581D5CB|nr:MULTISPECIES: hypothetical protein [Halomonas]MDI4636703.1 hypothetical protein [Halomonas sp. BMC7]NUJ61068.1 hypothetical protein [Halomonas taeanensis]
MASEKIKFDIPDSQFPFVPPIGELLNWLSGPKQTHTALHWMQQKLNQPKPDLKTLRKACREGVTPRTADIIKNNVYEAVRKMGFPDPFEYSNAAGPIVNGTNGAKWLVQAKTFLEGINRRQPIMLELPQTFAFLQRRSEAESQLVLTFHRTRKLEISTEERLSLIYNAFCDTCRHHTFLKPQEIQTYGTAIVKINRPEYTNTPELLADVFKCTFNLRLDFYHQLLATFMADMLPLRETLQLPHILDDALMDHGAMGQLMPLLEKGELITPTYRLYELWCDAFSPPGESLSYRAMAMYLPQPDKLRTRVRGNAGLQDILDAANDTRYRILKEWRSGTVPETYHLTQFLESLSGKDYGAFLPFVMTRVATAWSKWIIQELASFDQILQEASPLTGLLDRDWLIQKFSRYPEYWRHVKAQGILKTP